MAVDYGQSILDENALGVLGGRSGEGFRYVGDQVIAVFVEDDDAVFSVIVVAS